MNFGYQANSCFNLTRLVRIVPGTVTAHLYGIFSMRLIKTGGPLELPARSADLIPRDL
jgi:hypothetical protein